MKPSRSRAVRYVTGLALTAGIAAACSSDPAPLPSGFNGVPGSVDIARVSLSNGNVLDGGSTQLGCDAQVGVALDVAHWDLRQPGACPVTQCGRVRLELSDASGKYVRSVDSASAGIVLSIVPYDTVTTAADGGTSRETHVPTSGTYTLTASLINDAGMAYNPGAPGKGSAQVSFELELPTNCESAGGGGGAGGAGPTAEGGAAGLAGSAGAPEAAGAAGESAAGESAAGASGSDGTSGASGAPPAAGAPAE